MNFPVSAVCSGLCVQVLQQSQLHKFHFGLQFCECASFTAVRKFHSRVAHLSSLRACFTRFCFLHEHMVCMSEVHMFKNTWLLLSPGLKCQTIGQDCSGAQMTINGRSRVTSVRWVFVAIILTLPASEQSIWWPFDFYIFISIFFVFHLAGVLTMGVPSSLGGLAVVSILLLPFKSTHWLKGSGNY